MYTYIHNYFKIQSKPAGMHQNSNIMFLSDGNMSDCFFSYSNNFSELYKFFMTLK